MPNYVTNRLEINADRETVQNVMDFLKGETDEDSTPCYIDFNNIIPMPKDRLFQLPTCSILPTIPIRWHFRHLFRQKKVTSIYVSEGQCLVEIRCITTLMHI